MEVHEVVISGIGGRFPNCESVEELAECLRNKVNLVSNEGRWEAGELNVPHQVGKLNDPYAFDLTYFGIHRKLGEYMDPNVKCVLENSIAAIHDAGRNLDEVIGQDVATIVGSSLLETEYEVIINNHRMDQTILSHSACMQANRLAYYLDLRGPSYVCESGWNGAISALRHARNLVARGHCDAALVSGSSLLFLPQVSYHYQRLGRLNEDGKTKCFSDDADGYSRAEASITFFLQRKEDALRNYGSILEVNVTQNGSKDKPLVDCSCLKSSFLKNIYEQKNIDPSSVAYLEASGCASKVIDAQELNVITEVFLGSRTEPLLVGSVKSNMGHAEAASGFAGIVKAIIAAEEDIIPPNLHYSAPNTMVPALLSGKLQVVSEPTPLKGDLLAINNISATGGFAHTILRRNTKTKKRKCEVGTLPPDGIPRIVLLSARELDSLNKILDKVEGMPIDEEFVALTHRAFGKGIKRHMHRGYTVLGDFETQPKFRQVKEYPGGKPKPLWFVFAGMGSQWPGMASDLMKLPTFSKAIYYCHELLKPFGLDLIDIVTNPRPDMFDNILNCFVGIAAVQVGLLDILRELGLEPDGLVGHSLGELGCAYCDGTFTAKQMIMGAYYRGKVSADSGIKDGLMAAVGKGYQYIKDEIPAGIDIACRNSSTSCTISGPKTLIQEYIEELSRNGIFVRSVPSGSIAYHSRYIQQLGPAFLKALKELVPNPKPRSSKWISSSVPEDRWDTDDAKLSSAEYHTNNLLSPVLFEEAITHIPKDAIILEVAPRGLLCAILKRALPSASYISLTSKDDFGHLHILSALGKLYNEGVFVDIQKMYPPVEFPVSRGTPSLAPLITWIHNESWRDYAFLERKKEIFTVKDLDLNNTHESKYNVLSDYKIYNNPIAPPSMFIDAVLDVFHKISKEPVTTLLLENIFFKKVIKYGDETPIRLALQEGSGCWEFSSKKDLIAAGRIDVVPFLKPSEKIHSTHVPCETLTSTEIYSYLSEMGLSVNTNFKLMNYMSLNEDGSSAEAEINWDCDWLTFIDSLLVMITFVNSYYKNKLYLVQQITQILIDCNFFSMVEKRVINVRYNKTIGFLWADGLEILCPIIKEVNIDFSSTKRREFHIPKFITLGRNEGISQSYLSFLVLCTKVILQNTLERKLQVFSLCENVCKQKDIYNIFKKNFESQEILTTLLADDSMLLYTQKIDLYNSTVLIINESATLDNTLKTLCKAKCGYLLCHNVESSTSLTCILSCKFGNDTIFLYKTVLEHKSDPAIVMMNPNWKEELKASLMKSKDRTVYLCGYYTSLNYVHKVVQQCSSFKNSDLLRFVFMEAKCNEFKIEKYRELWNKDVRVNIEKNGEWGTYVFYPVDLPLLSNQSLKNNNTVYQFSNIIKVHGINICALGLSMAGMMENVKKLGLFEYSGVQRGTPVCGLATLNEKTTVLELNPVFSWNKPENWSHEDIAATLLSYTIAYKLIVIELRDYEVPPERVLVMNGELPLSQAIIQVALRKGLKVYITYDDVYSTKNGIKKLFPEVQECNILKADKSLDIRLNFETEGKGISIVVNTSNDSHMLQPALNLLGSHSKFYQVSAKETEPGEVMGMRTFLKPSCVSGVGPELLLACSEREKQELKEMVNTGLRNGEIRPIKKYVLPPYIFNTDAMSKMGEDFAISKKFVISTTDAYNQNGVSDSLFICKAEKLYIILGKENAMWFDLIQWLISRGGRKFTIMVDNISPLLAKRLTVLLSHNESLTVNLYSTQKLKTAEKAHYFMSQTEENVKIGAIFIYGKEYFSVMNSISKDLNATRLVLIGEDIELNLNGKSLSSKPLAIEVPHSKTDFFSILKNLDALMSGTEPVVYMKEYSMNFNGVDTSQVTYWQHLPDCITSIAYLSRSSGKAGWKEVRTNSISHAKNRDLPPVFILPSLRRGQLDKMIRNLFHPAFSAVIPGHIDSLQELTQQLAQAMEKFDIGVFTIICADWSYKIGLALGKILEEKGKTVSLLLLDTNTSWVHHGVLKSVYDKAKKSLSMEAGNHNKKVLTMFEKGFEILKNHAEVVCNCSLTTSPKLKGFCHVFVPKIFEKDLKHINEQFERQIKVHPLEKEDYLEMVESKELVRIINTISMVETKDKAHPVPRDYETVKLLASPMSD